MRKKFFKLLVFIGIFCSFQMLSAASMEIQTAMASVRVYYGDLTGDGKVSITDLSTLKQALSGTVNLTADEKKRADLNGDGKVDKADQQLMTNYIIGIITEFPVEGSSMSKPSVSYSLHVCDKGWMNYVNDGATGGTTGLALRAEAIKIQIKGMEGDISYRTHIQDIGWTSWSKNNAQSGTTGRKLQMEAIEIKLSGKIASYYNVYYRAHCSDYGWLGWACNGESAGTTGGAKQLEAVQIKLVSKNETINKGGKAYYALTRSPDTSAVNTAGFQMPLTGARCSWRSSSNWSWGENVNGGGYSSSRVYHLGADLIGSSDNVYATANGTVVRSGWNNANGNYVVIQHSISGKTIYSFYAHLSSRSVSQGTSVSKGQKIGVVGNTGSSSRGKHLHFAMMDTLWNGSYYGYSTYFTGNKVYYQGVTYYNPIYIVQNGKLP